MPGNIVLVGFSGSGKSTVGRIIAARAGRPFLDVDEDIVSRLGMPIGEAFSRLGEAHFREVETRAVADACARRGCVIALGGGALERDANLAAARAGNVLVRLDAPPDEILRRLFAAHATEERPMLRGDDPRGRITRLLLEREPRYALADHSIGTEGRTPEEVADLVLAAVEHLDDG